MSAVRCGRAVCPPGPARVTLTLSQAAVIAPARTPTGRRPAWVAVQREDPADGVQGACGDDGLGAARGLFRGLEDQPDAVGEQSGRRPLRKEQAGTDQHGRVRVVAAGVAGIPGIADR